MKRNRVLLPLVAFTLIAFQTGISAQPGGGPGHRMWAELNLTADQKTQLKALREEMQTFREKHIEAVKAVRDKIKAELLKTDPSQNTLYGYAGELGELHKQMTKDRTDHLLKVKKILTPEQFSKLVEQEGAMDRGKRFGPPGSGHCPHKGGHDGGPQGKCPYRNDPPEDAE